MKKLILRCLLLALIASVLLASCGLIQFLPAQFRESYNGAAADKIERLKQTDSPKIILVGGSSMAFGMDSKALSEACGMPVVNLGMHAGLGGHFLCEMAKPNIGEGDLVIVALEHSLFCSEKSELQTTLTTVENNPELIACLDKGQYTRILKGYLQKYGFEKLRRCIFGSVIEQNAYARSAFNTYGDNVYPREKNKLGKVAKTVVIDKSSILPEVLADLNTFNAYVRRQGAEVYYSYAPVDAAALFSDRRDVTAFAEVLESEIDAPFISDICDYVLPNKLFYDTAYHLNDEGVIVRTELLTADLQAVLPKQ